MAEKLKEPFEELRACIETLRPFTGRPIGAPGSFARREQEDRKWAYERAQQIIASLEQRTHSAGRRD